MKALAIQVQLTLGDTFYTEIPDDQFHEKQSVCLTDVEVYIIDSQSGATKVAGKFLSERRLQNKGK